MAEVILEEFNGANIPTNEKKVRLKKADGTYVIPLGRANAIFMSDGKNTLENVVDGKVDKKGNASIDGNLSVSGTIKATKTITTEADLISKKVFTTRILGENAQTDTQNTNKISIGNGDCRFDTTGGIFRIFTSKSGASKDNGLVIAKDGVLQIKINGTSRHEFYGNGTKKGGSMEIEGTVYGMSPIDSPQTLIEFIEYNVEVNGEKVIPLDNIYKKMISKYAVFSSNPDIKIIEKGVDSFKVQGTGKADFSIKGQRRGADEYYVIMGGFTHGSTEADSE